MFNKRLDELKGLIDRCVYTTRLGAIDADDALEMSQFLLSQVSKVDGIVYLIGNGGSAGIASHFCTDFLRTLGIGAATFSDSTILTCFANDFGYENVYKMPLERNLKSNDLLIAISSSGKSENIVKATKFAKERKVTTLTFSGFGANNPLCKLGDLNFWLDSHDYGLVETGHFFLLHTIVDTFNTCKKKSNNLLTSAT